MKSFRSMFKGYAVALLAALFMSASAQAATHNKGIIRAIRDGSADVSMDSGKTWKKAQVGTVIAANSAIRTDANSTVDVFLGDNGPVVRVTKATTLGFDKLDVDNGGIEKVIETQLDLKNGRILGNVKKMAAASKYEVKTPVGVAGIRGTEYSISSSGEVNVVSGTVVVVYIVNGNTLAPVTVTSGQGVVGVPPAGQQAQTTSIQQTTSGPGTASEVTTVTIGITTSPSGQLQATLENPNAPGATTVVTTSPNGTVIAPNPGQTVTLNTQSGVTTYATTGIGTSTTPPTGTVNPPPPPPTVITPTTTTTVNFDVTNSALTEDKPGS